MTASATSGAVGVGAGADGGRGGDAAVELGDLGDARLAQRLACRLVAEGIGAVAVGGVVWVREADRATALTCARLFHEVDTGRSRVAPAPGSWAGSAAGRAVRVAVVVALALVVLTALAIAVSL